MEHTHLAFSDESGHLSGRFRSVALITVNADHVEALRGGLRNILTTSDIGEEFKWEKLRSAKYQFAAEKMHALAFANSDKIRIDVLVWDTTDSRNKDVPNRDDNENLGRMYYHLLQNVLGNRWPSESTWHWQPDVQSAMDWRSIGGYLISKKYKFASDLFGANEAGFLKLGLKRISARKSHEEPMVQLADYYAGLGAYSYASFENYAKWRTAASGQAVLFAVEVETYKASNAEKHRFPIIERVSSDCKNMKLSVSLESSKGFKTHDPKCFINFWLYQPQHVLDKAPSKPK